MTPSRSTSAVSLAPSRVRRWRAWIAGTALLAAAGPALAGAGTGLLNFFNGMRGHQDVVDQAYGPLDRQRFDLYRPGRDADPADAQKGTPLVIFVYGGSWDGGSRTDYKFAGESLAAQGFTVMVVDYRLYPEVRYPEFLQDCARAVGYGLEHAAGLGADPRRVFLYGHSAGAYNVAMLALDPRWLAAVGHSPTELAGWVGLAGPYNFLPIVDPGVQAVFGWPGTPANSQPINHVDDLAQPVPVFLGAAEHDSFVYPEQNTDPLAAKLRDHGAALTQREYAHVNHLTLAGALAWPLTPLAPVLRDTAAFIRQAAPAAPATRPVASTR